MGPSSAPRKTGIRRSTHKQVLATSAFHTAAEPHEVPHTIVRISARTHPNHQKPCTGTQGVASGCIRRALQRTTCTHTTRAHGPIAAALRRARPAPHAAGLPRVIAYVRAPVALRVELERGELELSLRTRHSANAHQPWHSCDLGASFRESSNEAAPLVIKASQRRLLGRHERHAMVLGPQLAVLVVRALENVLRVRVWRDE